MRGSGPTGALGVFGGMSRKCAPKIFLRRSRNFLQRHHFQHENNQLVLGENGVVGPCRSVQASIYYDRPLRAFLHGPYLFHIAGHLGQETLPKLLAASEDVHQPCVGRQVQGEFLGQKNKPVLSTKPSGLSSEKIFFAHIDNGWLTSFGIVKYSNLSDLECCLDSKKEKATIRIERLRSDKVLYRVRIHLGFGYGVIYCSDPGPAQLANLINVITRLVEGGHRDSSRSFEQKKRCRSELV